MINGDCPTPRKGRYDDRVLADSIMLQIKYNRGIDAEVYHCIDHFHIRDKNKRRNKDRVREKVNKQRRRQFRQLTIFDWMRERDGTQGV